MKRMIVLLAGLGFALPVTATPSVPVKCGANQERVWVYDSLATWDVSLRLKCDTPVDVLGLEKGYVKVRTSDGNEGYVPADAIPSSEMAELTAAAAPTPVAALPAATRAPAQQVVAQQAVAQPIAAPPVAQPMPARAIPVATSAPVAARVSAAPAPPAPVIATPPAAALAPAAPAYIPAPVQAPAPAPSVPAVTRMAAAPPVSQRPVTAAASVNNATYASATPAPRATTRENATLVVEQPSAPVRAAAPQPVATVVKAADFTPIAKTLVVPASVRDAEFSEEDDTPETAAAPVDNLSACSVFFSAYGLTPMQFKWIAEDRGKRFPAVCPAPEPSMVDYVVIFTHDMNFFSNTLPDPIHTDRNGFSDWSPITAADDTLIPVSSLDKAHHEYAWVFHIRRGTFDPANFTSRRRPQFTKAESSSHASSKSIEDAMEFIAGNGTSQ